MLPGSSICFFLHLILLISYFVHSFLAREGFINQCLYIDIHIRGKEVRYIFGLCNSVMQIWFAKPLSLNDKFASSNGWHIRLIKLELCRYAITLWLFRVFYLLKNQHSQTLIQPGQRNIMKTKTFVTSSLNFEIRVLDVQICKWPRINLIWYSETMFQLLVQI